MIIYKITNTVNGKSYIGKTIYSLERRWYDHCLRARIGSSFHLHRAIRLYGSEKFNVEILREIRNPKGLNHAEIFFIKRFDTFRNGYNMTVGGDGLGYNFRHTDASKRKMSLAARRRKPAGMLGKHHSLEARKKMSLAKLGRPSKLKGKHYSEEIRHKMSLAHRGPRGKYKPRSNKEV